MSELAFTHYDGDSVDDILDTVVGPLYLSSHEDVLGDPFYSSERFVERVRGYAKSPGFEMVVGELDDKPMGQAFGYVLPPKARWWSGLTTPVDPGLIEEDGRRTFALCELMVDPVAQRQGLARRLHDELLYNRPEHRATLLTREDNEPAQIAYAKWGWQKIGKLQPYPDAPNYDALVLELRATG